MKRIIILDGALINIDGVICQCVLDTKDRTCNVCPIPELTDCITYACSLSNRNYTNSIHFEELNAIIY